MLLLTVCPEGFHGEEMDETSWGPVWRVSSGPFCAVGHIPIVGLPRGRLLPKGGSLLSNKTCKTV